MEGVVRLQVLLTSERRVGGHAVLQLCEGLLLSNRYLNLSWRGLVHVEQLQHIHMTSFELRPALNEHEGFSSFEGGQGLITEA